MLWPVAFRIILPRSFSPWSSLRKLMFCIKLLFLAGEGDDSKKKKKRRKLEPGESKKRKSDSTTKSPRKKRRKRAENEDGLETSKTDAKKTLFERRNIR